jgi:hypothetical protein
VFLHASVRACASVCRPIYSYMYEFVLVCMHVIVFEDLSCQNVLYYDFHLGLNKKFCEELISYFPSILHGPYRKLQV